MEILGTYVSLIFPNQWNEPLWSDQLLQPYVRGFEIRQNCLEFRQ